MNKYSVTLTFPVFVTVEVEAETEGDAIEAGFEEAGITSFCGNGGTDKLIGVYSGSIEAGDVALEDSDFAPTATRI